MEHHPTFPDRRDFAGDAIPGRLAYSQAVLDRIARRATAGIDGLRMEPPRSGDLLETVLLWRPLHALFRRLRRELCLDVPVQVASGWNIPDLCRRAQAAIADEVRRLTHYRKVTVNLHVSGTFRPGEEYEP